MRREREEKGKKEEIKKAEEGQRNSPMMNSAYGFEICNRVACHFFAAELMQR